MSHQYQSQRGGRSSCGYQHSYGDGGGYNDRGGFSNDRGGRGMPMNSRGSPMNYRGGRGSSSNHDVQNAGPSNYGGRSGPSNYRGRGGGHNNTDCYWIKNKDPQYGGKKERIESGSSPDLHQASKTSSYQVRQLIGTSPFQAGSSSLDFSGLSIQSEEPSKFPKRPGFGTLGRSCRVKTNHFLLELSPPLAQIHQYHVEFSPATTVKKLNGLVMRKLVEVYKETHLGNTLLAYDGQKCIYTASSLPFTSEIFNVVVINESGGTREFEVQIRSVSVIDLVAENVLSLKAIQALDVVLRQTPNSRYIPVKQLFFSDVLTANIGEGLQAWRGFHQSVRPTQNGLSLNIDVSSAVFVEPLMVTEFVKEVLNIRELSRNKTLSDVDRLKVRKALKGLKIEVTHRGNVRRKYTVSGVTREPTKEIMFPFGDGGHMKSVVEYFREKYHKNIEYASLPCLQVGSKATLLPMEVCKIVGGQRHTKKLSGEQTGKLVKLNSQKPRRREEEILELVRDSDYLEDEYAKQFCIRISEDPTHAEAHLLPPPLLNYHGTSCRPTSGQWNMAGKKLFKGATVTSWTCLNFAPNVPNELAGEFCQRLAISCYTHGMVFNRNPDIRPYTASRLRVAEELQKLHKMTMHLPKDKKQLDLLIVILPKENNAPLYGEIKRICETELGLVSQCVLDSTVQEMKPHTLANIVLKINVKVGGVNTVVKDVLPMVTDKPTIIFGADVTHPDPGDDSSPSIAAVVASQNWPHVTNYVPIFSTQQKEIILDLRRMIREHLRSFVKNNEQRKPERIIFYRDGVSEGQFSQVLEYELTAIQEAWDDEFKKFVVPPITFVVVQKRHHTKLFPANQNDVDKSGNVLAGTVVDSGICHPREFDFYLCSHAGIQGTSRPAHYHVLWDDNKFTADQLHTLTNGLCYIYARCTRSVSYASPAYYAHLAAARARCYLTDDPVSDESSGRSSTSNPTDVKQLPSLCNNLKNLPYYY